MGGSCQVSAMKILITGGQGTVGSFLHQRLATAYQVLAPGRDQLDLMDSEAVAEFLTVHQVDVVIHCALTGREQLFSTEPHWTTDSLWMFRNLWRNRDKFTKLINLGTAYELDLNQNNWMVTEDEMLQHLPQTSYGYAKNIISRIIRDTDDFYNLRLFGVFHEQEANHRFFKKLLRNGKITINNDVHFDYFYLGDLVPVIDKIIKDAPHLRDINMVYRDKYTMSQLAEMFCQIQGIDCKNVTVAATGQNNLTGSPSRLLDLNLNLTGLIAGFKLYTTATTINNNSI
jgi:UDP-glucose 4-epimerase